jgi:DNA-binding CsgD family transcriptional regulator
MTDGDSSAEIVDQIYEAAFIPEKWSNTIDIIAERSESASGSVLVFAGHRPPRFRSTELTRQALTDFCSGDGWKNSQRAPFMIEALPSRFLCDADYLTPEQMERDSVGRSLGSLGLGWQLGTAIPMPERSMVNFTFERRIDDGRHSAVQIDMLNGFRPHLARAGLLAARLGLERARNAAATLEYLGLPTFVLGRSGSVIAVNALAEGLSSVLLPAARGMLATTDPAANALLELAIGSAGSSSQPFVHSIPLKATADRGPMILHLVPLRGEANDIFSQASSLLIVTSVSMINPGMDGKILDALFDLSPSEARLALALASGSTLKEAATEGGIQLSTARSYLEVVFRKTGTHQQSQLVALLKSAQPLARRP